MDSTKKIYEIKQFKYGRHIILGLFFFFYSYTYSMVNSYFNVLAGKFCDEKESIFHSRLILISYAAALIILGILLSIHKFRQITLSRIMGIITLMSSLMFYFLFKTENKSVFFIMIYSASFLIGLECVYYYNFMYRAFSYLKHTGLIFAISMSCSILLQFQIQTVSKSENLVLYSLIIIAFISAFLNLSGASEYLANAGEDEIIRSQPPENSRFLPIFISTIIIIILFECIGNFLSYHLLALMYNGQAFVYNFPRLFIIISYILMGIFAEIDDMHYLPIITFAIVLVGILNPVLMQEKSLISVNTCIYYVVAGIINSFFMLIMFKLARGKKFAPLIAVCGRIIDSIFSFVFISSFFSSLPLYNIIGIELTAIIIVMLLFTFSGQFNFRNIRQNASWHITPIDFAKKYEFTEKETEVFIAAISFDGTMSELAKSLYISRSVLYRNLSNICDKTGCGSFQAVKYLYYELPAIDTSINLLSKESACIISDTNAESTYIQKPEEKNDTKPSKSQEVRDEKEQTSFEEKYALTSKEVITLKAFIENPDKTQKELADMQGTTLRTIQRHLANIKSKTKTKSLIELSNLYNSER